MTNSLQVRGGKVKISQPAAAAVFVLLCCSAQAEGPESRQPGSFPLPSVDGKILAPAGDAKSFRVPMRFQKVEQFYRDQFKDQKEVTLKLADVEGGKKLTLTSKRKGDTWTKAVVKEGTVDTTVEVTPVLRISELEIEGSGKPLVQFIFSRSPEAAKAAASIDHTGR
jgi:hypothetical protein